MRAGSPNDEDLPGKLMDDKRIHLCKSIYFSHDSISDSVPGAGGKTKKRREKRNMTGRIARAIPANIAQYKQERVWVRERDCFAAADSLSLPNTRLPPPQTKLRGGNVCTYLVHNALIKQWPVSKAYICMRGGGGHRVCKVPRANATLHTAYISTGFIRIAHLAG